MRCKTLAGARLAVFGLLVTGSAFVRAEPPPAVTDEPSIRRTIERGLEFLQADAAKWRKDRECATCHHGTLTVWALSEAQSRGYAVPAETQAELVAWAKGRVLERADLPRDSRPGWSMVNSSALYLAVMAAVLPQQTAVSADELKRVTGHLLRHQEADGSWSWASAPAKNRPPPFFESDEVATLLGWIALGPQVPADPEEKSEAREARVRAQAWLAKNDRNDTTQAAAFRLLAHVVAREPLETVQPEIDTFLRRQNADGGWGQLPFAASDAYATGQALYVLGVAGVQPDRVEFRRGVSFLVATQREDGSWPMTSRSHPGATPFKNPVPITYFGSAWATLGLMRAAPGGPAKQE